MSANTSSQWRFTADSWLMTFGDLLGILVALFVLIYASSDQHADRLTRAVISLSDNLRDATGELHESQFSALDGPYAYQVALLERNLEALPQWTLTEDLPERITLTLDNWALENALGDGLWLESVERFERPVWMTLHVADQEGATRAAQAVMILQAQRAALGLTGPWGVEIKRVGDLAAPKTVIDIPLSGKTAGYTMREKASAQAEEVAP